MSQGKRVSRAGTSAPSPKRHRTVLTSEQKREIYDFYLEFCENQSRVSSRSRQGKPTKKRPHNHSFVTDSYDSRPRAFQTVGLSTWKKVIKAGKDDSSGAKWRQIGRPTTLSVQEESTLDEHIKATASAGHLVTNNAIIIWALQILAESPRFLAFSSEEQQKCVSRMEGKN